MSCVPFPILCFPSSFFLKVMHINCTRYWVSLWLFHKCVRYNLIIFTHHFPSSVPSLSSHGSLSSLFHLSLFKTQLHYEWEKCAIVKSGLSHWTSWLSSPSTFLQTIWPYYLLWLSGTPLGTSAALPLSVHLLAGTWADSVTWLPWIMLPWTWMYRHCCCLWLWLGIYPRVHQNAAESHGSSTFSSLRHLLFSLFPVN